MSAEFETLSELSHRLASGEVSAVELVTAALARAEATQSTLHAFAGLRPERARAEAAQADARRRRGEARSAIDGIPVAIKDNMVQTGELTTCASRILEGFVSPYTATAVARLEQAGAVVIGRTNMDEFAMGSSTEHSCAGADAQSVAPGEHARRLLGRLGGGRRGRASCPRRWAATPGARSASRPAFAAWWGSSRPTAGSRAGDWSPSPPRSTRSASSRAARATPPACSS